MDFKSRKHNIESLKEIAQKRGWQLLSEQYLGGSIKHDFICDKGHTIKKTMELFLRGTNCLVCSGKSRLIIEDFRLEAKKNGWELLTKEYTGVDQMLHLKCKKCGLEFFKKSSYLRGKKKVKNCPNCDPLKKKTIEEIKIYAEKKGLSCLSNEYVGISEKLLWKCKYNHSWMATPNDIFNNDSGCPDCKRFKTEAKVKFALEKYFGGKKFPKKSKIKTSYGFHLELDGYNEELKMAFEYNGIQHYEYTPYYHGGDVKKFENQKNRDVKKIEYCNANQIHLIIIPYWAKTNVELVDSIMASLPENIEKNKDRLLHILENYGRDSDELEPIREKLKSINMLLLSNTYTGVNDKNQFIRCLQCGFEYLSSHSLIRKMKTCRNCAKNKTFTIDDLKKIANDNNIILISKEYKPQSLAEWKCHKGHFWQARPSIIKGTKLRKGTNCPICFGKHKTTIEQVRALSESRGHRCLSDSISNRFSRLTFECRKNPSEVHVWDSTFTSYQNSKNGCVYCTGRKKYVASV